MITTKNLKQVLQYLGFTSKGDVYSKKFEAFDCYLKVDFKKGEIIYPEKKGLKINRKDTTHLKSPENFVVFECVNRLLEKGYNPKHIELEHSFDSGHGLNYGRADILIRDNTNKTILFIECKTAGNEFTKAWKTTLEDGGQIFSYASKEGSKPFICLYASDFSDNKVKANYRLITLKDNKQYLEDNPKLIGFKDAFKKDELFNVWKKTYLQDYSTKGLFENDIQAFNIGKKKYTIDDLSLVDSSTKQSKHHDFATILRKYNVSGRENAFDKLVNLFLCKIVDEKNNPKDLQFYWKGIAYDTPFELQDRLQKLYQTGMNEFLKEDVTYIDNQQIDKAFWAFKNDPDSTKETIKSYFKQLKFFTNNDFAFIDVHNERLFYENAEVLIDIARLFQDTKIKSNSKNQFLGDMFENFLDDGVKQSEGRFFTPMPITRFIIQSLPLENIINQSPQIPKAIDYACGSGHFLNELASQMRPFIEANKDVSLEDYHKEIHGIEKEYRLSKVAKVSAFMYGQDHIDITYADALAKNDKFTNNDYKILVANPPYSVKGFLSTLDQESKNNYELLETLDNKQISTNNSIECFFIERAKQLLAGNGVAAIIVPSSILSNDNRTYANTRSILLKYFDIVSIAELGSGTFGKTGTNTVTLFIRRKDNKPEQADHYANRIEDWFSTKDKKQKVFEDEHFIESYCKHIEIDFKNYKTLLVGKPSKELLKTEMFSEYEESFNKLTSIKNKKKQLSFKKLSKEKQLEELDSLYLKYLTKIEKEKMYYFVLASLNPSKVLITKVNESTKKDKKQRTKEQSVFNKKYVGYEWSSAKGNAGIQLFLDEKGNHITPLYDPKTRNNKEKINYYIQKAFNGETDNIPDTLKDKISFSNLIDLIDFKRTNFDKQISIDTKVEVQLKTKWPLKKLGELCEVKIGGTPARAISKYFSGDNLWVSISEMNGETITDTKEKITKEATEKSNVKLIPKGTTLLSFKLSIGKTATAGKDLYTNEAIAGLIPKKDNILDSYLLHLFNSKLIDLENVGDKAFGKSLNSAYLRSEVKIPLPTIDIQQKIINECGKVDLEKEQTRKEINKAQESITTIVNESFSKYKTTKLSNISTLITKGSSPKWQGVKYIEGKGVLFVTSENVREGFLDLTNKKYVETKFNDIQKKSILEKDDVLINIVGASIGRAAIYNIEDIANINQAVALVRLKKNKVITKLLNVFLNSANIIESYNSMKKDVARANLSLQNVSDLKIPLPSIIEQKSIMKKIDIQEAIIEKGNNVIRTIAERKQDVLKKYI